MNRHKPTTRTLSFLRVALLSATMLLLAASAARALPVMGKFMLDDSFRLAYSNKTSRPLPPGWKISDIHIGDQYIHITLRPRGGPSTTLRLVHPFMPVKGAVIGRSLSFRAEQLGSRSPAARKAALALLARVQRNDQSYFFAGDKMSQRELFSQFLFQRYVFIPLFDNPFGFLVVAIIISAFLGFFTLTNIVDIRASLLPSSPAAALALVAILATGLLFRLFLSPAAPIHCNSHGVDEVRAYLSGDSIKTADTFYGPVFPATMRGLLNIFGRDPKNIFLLNQFFGSLAVFSLFMFARALLLSDVAALAAALFLAFSPGQVWLSGTESQIPLYLFASLAGLAVLCAAIRRRNFTFFYTAALIIAYAASLRILTVLLFPAAVLSALYVASEEKPALGPAQIRNISIASILVGAWVFFYYLSIPTMTGQGWTQLKPAELLAWFADERNILWDPTLTPFVIPALAAAGLLAALFLNRRLALYSALAIALMVPLTMTVVDCRTTAVRYQLQAYWVYYLPAAWVVSLIAKNKSRLVRLGVPALLLALFIPNAVRGLSLLHKGDEEINEYRFLETTAPKIPTGAYIRLPVKNAIRGNLITDYPDYINRQRIVRGFEPSPRGANEFIYLGINCYNYEPAEELRGEILPNGLRRQCRDICPGRLVPVHETVLDATSPNIGFQRRFYKVSSKHPTIGFYRCEPNR